MQVFSHSNLIDEDQSDDIHALIFVGTIHLSEDLAEGFLVVRILRLFSLPIGALAKRILRLERFQNIDIKLDNLLDNAAQTAAGPTEHVICLITDLLDS
jgi:hypothetical protein